MIRAEQSLYELLEVDEAASSREITLAFRRLAKRWHPDLSSERPEEATEQMKQLSVAYEVLSDPVRRAHYDIDRHSRLRHLENQGAGHGSGASAGPWWTVSDESGVDVITDPEPPPPLCCRSRLSLEPACLGAAARALLGLRDPHGRRDPRLSLIWVLGLMACPFLSFFLAAWSARDLHWWGWGILYGCAPALWGIGAITGSPVPVRAGQALLLAGAAHRLGCRDRLDRAIERSPRDQAC